MLASIIYLEQAGAQQSTVNYDLSNYKLPTLKRHVLEFNFDIVGNSTSTKSEYNNNDTLESNQNQYSLGISPFYSYYLNTEKYQFQYYLTADLPELSYNSFKDPIDRAHSLNFYPYVDNSGELREYLKRKFFLEQDFHVSMNLKKYNWFGESINDSSVVYTDSHQKTTHYNINLSIPVLAGWGRIEQVEDARLAVYILDDLNKAGQLNREINEADIEKLAELISKVQNECFFDSRLAKIRQLKQVDSLLMSISLIDSSNIEYYSLLNDNWDYADGPVRESGFRVSAGFSPVYYFYNSKYTDERNYYNPDTSITFQTQRKIYNSENGFLLIINYERPLNLYWQLSLSNNFVISKTFSREFYNRVDLDTIQKMNRVDVNNYLSGSLKYYPNSRTTMSLYLTESFYYWKKKENDVENTNELGLTSGIGINIDY